ncbi:heme biosynthesis HemY N-terminal domain-containing protein [Methyloligella sp. 2.7D]|uniref:heme biosynthesis protein HemY n=1 Tax=unclassified Methyloligella TaxID=2625955 RepID=UPI00157D7CD0|nr:heme biosynthesis HemY N-terminal domain-containing protein [Methyloligella sp. GL2]QKP76180.1 heme biosynthesis protein HemY [Methyloligella sp. GL2]
MIRILTFIVAIGLIAFGFAWLADQPGSIQVEWFGYQIETSAFVGAVAVALLAAAVLFLWSFFRFLLTRPGAIASSVKERRRRHGFEALTRGFLAIGVGDRAQAQQSASAARRMLPHEPLTALLKAQAFQLKDDREGARRAFEAMLDNPKTELLGLRGLFLEAKRRGDAEAARQFAEQTVEKNPNLGWSVNALLDLQARANDWEDALKTLSTARQYDHIDGKTALRDRAVLLTAEATELERLNPDKALELASEAHRIAPELIPAAEIAGRILASKGDTRRASRLLAKTWKKAPHPDLALVYGHAKPGESPKERLKRVKYLAGTTPDEIEGHIAVANAAIEAHEWEEARLALAPYIADRPSARICALMARIEAGEFGDRGREREWLARAVRAPRDRAWIADGYISDRWLPASPVTGKLDAFEWKAPVDAIGRGDDSLIIEEPAGEEAEEPKVLPSDVEHQPAAEDVSPPREIEASATPVEVMPAQETSEQKPQETSQETSEEPPAITASWAGETEEEQGAKDELPREMPPLDKPVSEETAKAQKPPRYEPIREEAAAPAAEEPKPGAKLDAEPPTEPAPAPRTEASAEQSYIPSRPPDDPGVGSEDYEESESDLERLRSAHVR